MITRICKNRMAGGLMLAGLLATHLGAELVTVPGLAARSGPVRDLAGQELASIIRAKEAC